MHSAVLGIQCYFSWKKWECSNGGSLRHQSYLRCISFPSIYFEPLHFPSSLSPTCYIKGGCIWQNLIHQLRWSAINSSVSQWLLEQNFATLWNLNFENVSSSSPKLFQLKNHSQPIEVSEGHGPMGPRNQKRSLTLQKDSLPYFWLFHILSGIRFATLFSAVEDYNANVLFLHFQ